MRPMVRRDFAALERSFDAISQRRTTLNTTEESKGFGVESFVVHRKFGAVHGEMYRARGEISQ